MENIAVNISYELNVKLQLSVQYSFIDRTRFRNNFPRNFVFKLFWQDSPVSYDCKFVAQRYALVLVTTTNQATVQCFPDIHQRASRLLHLTNTHHAYIESLTSHNKMCIQLLEYDDSSISVMAISMKNRIS